MKTITLKVTSTHYLLEVDRASVGQEPILLQADGEPVAVWVSPADYDAFQTWQAAQQTPSAPPVPAEFEREVAAFEQLKPLLQEQYGGRVVAIHQGQVVAVGSDKMAVLDSVLETLGPVPCYIEWVEPDTPRRVQISSAWVAR